MLPMVELTIFALGILLIDLMVPREWKWINAAGAFVGVVFAAVGVSWLARALALDQPVRRLCRRGVCGCVRMANSVDVAADGFLVRVLQRAISRSLRHLFLVSVSGGGGHRHPDVGALSRTGRRAPRRVLFPAAAFGGGHDVHGGGIRHRAALHRARTDGDFHVRAGWFFSGGPSF